MTTTEIGLVAAQKEIAELRTALRRANREQTHVHYTATTCVMCSICGLLTASICSTIILGYFVLAFVTKAIMH
jgi:hypothetical protein